MGWDRLGRQCAALVRGRQQRRWRRFIAQAEELAAAMLELQKMTGGGGVEQ
jgi:hypothetical protein